MNTMQLRTNLRYDRVDSVYLNCLTDNLAVLLDHLGIIDIRTPFACQWYFDFNAATNQGLPQLEHVPVEEMIRLQTGCVIHTFSFDRSHVVEQCEEFIGQDRPVLAFGDAHLMSWLPYFKHEHMTHSFIIDSVNRANQTAHIVDAYYNHTEWGEATPTDISIPLSTLEQIIIESQIPESGSFIIIQKEEHVTPLALSPLLRHNAEQIIVQVQEKDLLRHFSHYYKNEITNPTTMKHFVLACWLVARARTFHQLWLSDVARDHPDLLEPAFPETFYQNVSLPWQKVSEFAYILLRRVSQGRRPPDTCFQMIETTLYPNEIQTAISLTQALPKEH